MARNEEKAQLMLNKWVTMKESFNSGQAQERRPFLASDCGSLADCEKWRMQIVREVTKKVASVQNAGLGEHKLRDLNDTINKLLREKGHWQRRIRDLGGPDYNALEPKALNVEKVAEAAVAAHPGDLDSQRDFVAKVAQNTESDEYVK